MSTAPHAPSDQPTPSAPAVPTRRMSFDASLEDLPRYFAADGDLIVSHVFAVFSAVFPDGEDFFVRTVRHYRDQITDPELQRQVSGFIGQESMHGREHRALNRRLAALGYPTARLERGTKAGLALRERIMSPEANLALTAALEHVTATLAELLLSSEDARVSLGHPAVRDLLVWHALEESEHKAVAFDVYRAVGGSERTRILTMKVTRYTFVLGMTFQVLLSLLADRRTYRPGVFRASFRYLLTTPLFRGGVWSSLCEYDRKGFHPDDRDTTALVTEWRERLFGEDGTLNDKLVRRSDAA